MGKTTYVSIINESNRKLFNRSTEKDKVALRIQHIGLAFPRNFELRSICDAIFAKGVNMKKIIQIAHVVKDLDKSMENYYKYLGIGPWNIYTFAQPALRESMYMGKPSDHTYRLAITWVGDVQLELIQPLTGHSSYDEFLDKKGEGLHHIKEFSEDCQKTIEGYKKKGIEVIQSGKFDEDEFYYLNTEPILGILYEIGNNGKLRPPERKYPT